MGDNEIGGSKTRVDAVRQEKGIWVVGLHSEGRLRGWAATLGTTRGSKDLIKRGQEEPGVSVLQR